MTVVYRSHVQLQFDRLPSSVKKSDHKFAYNLKTSTSVTKALQKLPKSNHGDYKTRLKRVNGVKSQIAKAIIWLGKFKRLTH